MTRNKQANGEYDYATSQLLHFVSRSICCLLSQKNVKMFMVYLSLPQRLKKFSYFLFLFRVSHCTECKMSASNLAKVFGPTIVQNSSSNLEPRQMLQEAKWQLKV